MDRTDEEFGDEDEGSLEIDLSYPGRPPVPAPLVSPSLYPSQAFTPRASLASYDATVPQPTFAPSLPSPAYPQHNHTSQYSQDYDQAGPPSYPSPPPAHEDPTTAHGFLPPPPALPLPEFSEVCHRPKSVVAELPDPMEERTFTVLQSKDETVASSLVSMSPSREVLDLSMPKLDISDHESTKDEDSEPVMTNGHNGHLYEADEALDFSIKAEESFVNGSNGYASESQTQVFYQEEVIVDVVGDVEEEDIDPRSFVQEILSEILETVFDGKEKGQKEEEPSEDDDSKPKENGTNGIDTPDEDTDKSYEVKVKRVKKDDDELEDSDDTEDEELVIFEPNKMPTMPKANIALAADRNRGAAKGLFERGLTAEEWREFEDYADFMGDEDEFPEDPDVRTSSPVQFDDPNRIDCKFCGMIFTDSHVRKFHEQSHADDTEEVYDEGELTRLFCGFCGKNFKKAQYRIMHEKGHTGELPVQCRNCNRQFRCTFHILPLSTLTGILLTFHVQMGIRA